MLPKEIPLETGTYLDFSRAINDIPCCPLEELLFPWWLDDIWYDGFGFQAKENPWFEDELIFETIWNTCYSLGLQAKDKLFDVLLIWLHADIWNIYLGFGVPLKK